jgi:hypothetical protein
MADNRMNETRMRKSQNLPFDTVTLLLDAVGGEQVAGSGFEAEEPDRDFASAELSEDESQPH